MPDNQPPVPAGPSLVMYSMPGCPFCDLARRYLDGAGIPFGEVKEEDPTQRRELYAFWNREASAQAPHKSFPAIFLVWGDTWTLLGGYQDIVRDDLARQWRFMAGAEVPQSRMAMVLAEAAAVVDKSVDCEGKAPAEGAKATETVGLEPVRAVPLAARPEGLWDAFLGWWANALWGARA